MTLGYDSLRRVNKRTTTHDGTAVLTDTISYGEQADSSTTQVSSRHIQVTHDDIVYSYTYDDRGNIASIKETHTYDIPRSSLNYSTTYEYDEQNQLIRENNEAANRTYIWTYDAVGNIVRRDSYNYTTIATDSLGTSVGAITYVYDDSNWSDLLTRYNGTPLIYDSSGNLKRDNHWNYTWENGRQLASMYNGSNIWNFTYQADGLRTARTNSSTTYNYIYGGDKLLRMTVDGNTLDFTYDASGSPLSVTFNGAIYYYVTNLQGDVIRILDSAGNTVVVYIYDAWGNIFTIDGSEADTIGQYNPLRYRGYVYDRETGLYYLQSRYYNPEMGRFINADDFETLLEDYETMLQYNLFAYCWNNPVNMHDPDGYWTFALAGGGYLATAGTLGATNIWHPAGWIVLGTVVVATAVVAGIDVYESVKGSSGNEADPYARPGQKKQGRERKNKARKSKDWKPRSNPKPPKKHTPGRDHRKFK